MYSTKNNMHYIKCGKYISEKLHKKFWLLISIQKYFGMQKSELQYFIGKFFHTVLVGGFRRFGGHHVPGD